MSLVDTVGLEILMHRDAHFAGNFDVMLEYYEQNGVGVMPDFSLDLIKALQKEEGLLGKNLSDEFLPETAKEEVTKSKKLYLELRNIYSEKSPLEGSLFLSDLILSEEETPQKEIDQIVTKGTEMVPPLIYLISSSTFYDPLYPGYGRTPIFAAKCLEMINDERAIPPLFEALGQDNFFTDDAIIHALCSFGEKSKSFLIKRLQQKPLSKDNIHAAIVLSSFPEDEEIAQCALNLLEEEGVLENSSIANYLIFTCSYLTNDEDRKRFIKLSQTPELSSNLLSEMNIVIKNWQ